MKYKVVLSESDIEKILQEKFHTAGEVEFIYNESSGYNFDAPELTIELYLDENPLNDN